jgi:excisionase family DNA binding protein
MTELLTVKQVALMLKVHPNTVYQRVKRGELAAYKPGYELLFKPEDVTAYLENSKVTSNDESDNAIPQNTIA